MSTVPPLWPNMLHTGAPSGVSTPYGHFLPPGGRVAAYVRGTNGTVLDWDAEDLPGTGSKPGLIRATLAEGLAQCRDGKPDCVIVLPGHTENVTSTFLSGLKAGTRILGPGKWAGSLIPTFTWNATASTMAISVANVLMAGLKFAINGANDITKGINVTAADCAIMGCDINVSADTDLHAAIGIEVGSAAHRFSFIQNEVIGTSDAVTDCLIVVGATPPSDTLIHKNYFSVIGHVTKGLIHYTVAALRARITENQIHNVVADAEFALVCDAVASRGFVDGNRYYVNKASVNANVQGTSQGAGCLWHNGLNYCNDEVVKSGVLSPAAAT